MAWYPKDNVSDGRENGRSSPREKDWYDGREQRENWRTAGKRRESLNEEAKLL